MTQPDSHELAPGEELDFSKTRAMKKEHDIIVAWALDKFQSIKNARAAIERQWYLNMAFYFGKQNVAILRAGQNFSNSMGVPKLYTPPAPYYRSRPVINRIRPIIRTELSHLTANKPSASVVPASAEDRDMYAAMAGEQIWEYHYIQKKVKQETRQAMLWNLVTGNSFMKCWWDFAQKDTMFHHETPFHVLVPDFREVELENQPFMIHAQVKSQEYVNMHFPRGIDGSPINKGSVGDATDILEESFLNLIGTQALAKEHNALVLEFWIKPGQNSKFPEGAFFTIVGNKIVQGFRGWPYTHGEYPFAKFDHIPGGKFYSHSVIEDLIPLQKEYNRTRGQIIEAKNRMAKPQLLAARGSIDPSKITSEPGLVVSYTPGFPEPKPLQLQNLPSYVMQELDRIIMDMNDISGQHEVTQGQAPPGVTAATAISYLQERDESKLSPTFDSLEEGLEKVARLTLNYVKDFWDDERLVKVTGPDGSFDAMAFKGSDLRDNTDIRIEGGSSLPVSKAAKQALIMDMMKMGFIDPQTGLEVMDMGGVNKLYEQVQVDKRQIQRENLRMSKVTPELMAMHEQQFLMQQQSMMQETLADPNNPVDPMLAQQAMMGVPLIVPVNTWDNHKMHIEGHNQYRKSQQFEALPDTVKVLFEEHVNAHLMAMGLETVTMDPRQAAGLPPIPLGDEEGQSQGNELNGPGQADPMAQQAPGPNPMPEMNGGMTQ